MLQSRINLLWGGAVVLLAAWMVWQATAWPLRTRLFPLAIGIPVLILALIHFGLALRQLRRDAGATGELETSPGVLTGVITRGPIAAEVETLDITARQALTISAWLLVFLSGVWALGFTIASTLLTLLFLRVAGREGWRLSLGVAAGILVLFVGAFDLALNVPLATGVVWDGLGIETPGRYLFRLWRALQAG